MNTGGTKPSESVRLKYKVLPIGYARIANTQIIAGMKKK
jgi:hypothetical protein